MPALGAGIDDLLENLKSWMAGTRPAMTAEADEALVGQSPIRAPSALACALTLTCLTRQQPAYRDKTTAPAPANRA